MAEHCCPATTVEARDAFTGLSQYKAPKRAFTASCLLCTQCCAGAIRGIASGESTANEHAVRCRKRHAPSSASSRGCFGAQRNCFVYQPNHTIYGGESSLIMTVASHKLAIVHDIINIISTLSRTCMTAQVRPHTLLKCGAALAVRCNARKSIVKTGPEQLGRAPSNVYRIAVEHDPKKQQKLAGVATTNTQPSDWPQIATCIVTAAQICYPPITSIHTRKQNPFLCISPEPTVHFRPPVAHFT